MRQSYLIIVRSLLVLGYLIQAKKYIGPFVRLSYHFRKLFIRSNVVLTMKFIYNEVQFQWFYSMNIIYPLSKHRQYIDYLPFYIFFASLLFFFLRSFNHWKSNKLSNYWSSYAWGGQLQANVVFIMFICLCFCLLVYTI